MEMITIALIAILLYLAYIFYGKDECTIPGPWNPPIVGHLPLLGSEPYRTLNSYARKYGEVFQLRLGVRRVVVLSSLEAIKEAFSKWEVADRPNVFSFRKTQEASGDRWSGITFFHVNPKWKFLRKSAVKALNIMLNSPDNRLEKYTETAIDYLTREFEQWDNRNGKDPEETVFFGVNSVISSLSFAKIFPPSDPFLKRVMEIGREFATFLFIGGILDFLPFLRPVFGSKPKKLFEVIVEQTKDLEKVIDEHEFNPAILDIQDALADPLANPEIRETMRQLGIRTESSVKNMGQDLFFAGTFTTSDHTSFFLRVCAVYPEVQRKMRRELDRALPPGTDFVSFRFRDRLPYIRAVEEELFRFVSNVPLSIAHQTTADVRVRGERIPAGTIVYPNLWAVHRDPSVFPEPERFRPERFLKSDGEFEDSLCRSMLPFSFGKRKCPGEMMARREIFLLIANLAHRFQVGWKWFEGKDAFDCHPGFVRTPKPARLTFRRI